jgi:hypothetical protein
MHVTLKEGRVMRVIYRVVTESDKPAISGKITIVQLGREYDTIEDARQAQLNWEWIGKDVWIQSREVTEWKDA